MRFKEWLWQHNPNWHLRYWFDEEPNPKQMEEVRYAIEVTKGEVLPQTDIRDMDVRIIKGVRRLDELPTPLKGRGFRSN